MKQLLYIFLTLLVFFSNTKAQKIPEYYFKFEIKDKVELDIITDIISVDNVKNNEVFAYALQHELDEFQKLGYKIQFLEKQIAKSYTMATTVAEMASWDRYPTFHRLPR